jgi:hypothetical protein
MRQFQKFLLSLLLVPLMAACAFVDETEHCTRTRYGKVVEQRVASGLRSTAIWEFTCMPTTERPFPAGDGGETAPSTIIPVITADSVSLEMEVAMDFVVVDGWAAFQAKRQYDRVLQEIGNALYSGTRQAGGQLKSFQLVGDALAVAEDSVRAAVQRNTGSYLKINRVYIRNPGLPQTISKAWNDAAVARANQQKAKDAFVNDSLEARRTVVQAQAAAQKRELEIRAMATSPVVLELEKTKAFAEGIANALSRCTSNCIIGGDVLQRYLSMNGRP